MSESIEQAVRRAERATGGSIAMMIEAGIRKGFENLALSQCCPAAPDGHNGWCTAPKVELCGCHDPARSMTEHKSHYDVPGESDGDLSADSPEGRNAQREHCRENHVEHKHLPSEWWCCKSSVCRHTPMEHHNADTASVCRNVDHEHFPGDPVLPTCTYNTPKSQNVVTHLPCRWCRATIGHNVGCAAYGE